MPLDAERMNTPGTAEWWLVALGRRLDADRPLLDRLDEYDRGEHPLPTGHSRARAAFQRFQRQSRSNFTGLVVDAVMDRLRVGGFRMGGQGSDTDELAQLIWQANGMDAAVRPVLRDALAMRRAYVIVGPDPAGPLANGSGVLLTGEDPRQVMHAWEPTNRRRVRAAIKTWNDELDGRDRAVVYLPDTVNYFVGPRRPAGTSDFGAAEQRWLAGSWEVDDGEGRDGVAPNPAAPFVPVVPLINRPEKDKDGFGEFQDVVAIQDRINQGTLDRLVTGAAQSFRQRWATGVIFRDEDGRDTQPFDPGADLMWHVEDEAARFGDFQATDLRPLLDAVKADVEQMASISRTPPYYLLGEMINLSGDALTAADTGATAKAEARQMQFGEALEHMMAVAFRVVDVDAPPDAETIWADAERRNEAKAADAAVKKQAVGVPWRQIMEDLGYSPAQIGRMEMERAADNLRTMLEATNLAAQAAAQQERIGTTEETVPQLS